MRTENNDTLENRANESNDTKKKDNDNGISTATLEREPSSKEMFDAFVSEQMGTENFFDDLDGEKTKELEELDKLHDDDFEYHDNFEKPRKHTKFGKTVKRVSKRKVVTVIVVTIILNIIFTTSVVNLIISSKVEQLNYRVENMLSLNEIGLTVEMELDKLGYPPIIENDEFYISLHSIKNSIDEYIFWDEVEQKITITNEHNVIRMQTESLEYYINDDILELDMPVYNINGVAYMPLSFLEDFYSLDVSYNDDSNMLTIFKTNYNSAKISKDAHVFSDESMVFSVTEINKNEEVYFKERGEELTEIVTESGFLGYVKSQYIRNVNTIEMTNLYTSNYEVEPLQLSSNGKINLVFDQMQNVVASTAESRRTPHDGMDVLVPTWFSFKDETGEIVNIADRGYVNWAHSEGYQVWGLLTDNFDSKISHAVLSSSETREYVIKQILAYVSIYNLDGINIDFENVPKDDGENFIQFLRELAPVLREQNAILSVDTFVPKPWTAHYNREELGKIVDYVIVMGYDEHYSGSDSAGSVASLSWSNSAIKDTLDENVPKEKLILGIPFYVRVWTETLTNGVIKLSSQALGMNGAYNFIIDKGGTFKYDQKTQQMYAEVTEDNKTYKVWLEDESSLEKRLNLVMDYDIAGVGAWKRGLEKDEVWELIEDILKD